MKAPLAAAAVAVALTGAAVTQPSSCNPPVVPTPLDAAAPDASRPTDASVADASRPADASPPADAAPPAPDASVPIPPCDAVNRRLPRPGSSRRTPRIVGGTTAQEGEFPFAVGLATSTRFQYCGGSLLSPRIVLTAAHCQVDVGDLALVGSIDLKKTRAVKVVASRIHARFNADTLDYDVAVAVLESDAGAAPVLLTSPTSVPPSATVIGWGATSEGGTTTTLLQKVDVPLVPDADCRKVYPSLTPRQFCAGRPSGGVDSCQGDSGGAIVTRAGAETRDLGIVSYGIGCARPGIPGVYTDLRNLEIRAWIAACGR